MEESARRKLPDEPIAKIAETLDLIYARIVALMPTPLTPGLPVTLIPPRNMGPRSLPERVGRWLRGALGHGSSRHAD